MDYRPRLRCLPKTLEVSIIYEGYFIVSGQRKRHRLTEDRWLDIVPGQITEGT